MLYSFYPVFIALILMIERQPITSLTKLRLTIGLPAVFLIVQAGGHETVDLVGVGFMLASAILYAMHLTINQRVLFEVPAPTVALYTLLAMSFTVMSIYAIFDRALPGLTVPWWPVLALAAITSLSRVLLFLGVKHLGGMQTALLGLSELLIAIFISQVWLGERLGIMQWFGAALLAISLFLVGFDKFSPEARRPMVWSNWLNTPGQAQLSSKQAAEIHAAQAQTAVRKPNLEPGVSQDSS